MDEMLAPYIRHIRRWREMGYEVIVTADHGQDARGHNGGRDDLQQLAALYYFGQGVGPEAMTELDQLQLAPTVLSRLGVPVPALMNGRVFLS